jgi:hypothetical protein
MSKRHHKPADPQEILRRRTERQATEAEIVRLRAMGAVVNLDRARRIQSAYRASPFRKLQEAETITAGQATAAERLTTDWAIWKGADGRPERLEVHSANYSAAELMTDRMLNAGVRVRLVLDKIGPMDRDLLAALVGSAIEQDRPLPWRDVVRRITGVTQTVRQSQMIVAALENLARAYSMGRDHHS